MPLSRSRFLSRLSLLALILGLVITGALISNAFDRLLNREKDKFLTLTSQVHNIISQRLNTSEEALYNLATFFNSSNNVDSEQFRLFSNEILTRHEYMHSSQYLPLVTYEKRDEFESSMHNDGYVTFSISEYRNGKYITAPPRESYYPVLYQEPFTPYTASMMGFDVLSNDNMSVAAIKAIESGNAISIYDVQPISNKGHYIIIKAMYTGKETPPTAENRRKDVNGLLMLRIDSAALIKDIPASDHLELTLYKDGNNSDKSQTLIAQYTGKNLFDGDDWTLSWNTMSESIPLPGGNITMQIRNPVHWQDTDNETMILSGIFGILLTFMLIATANIITFRTRKLQGMNKEISRLVDQRTKELSYEKDMLEHEMQVRQQVEHRLLNQQESMVKLSTSQVSRHGNLKEALQKITKIATQTLDIDRASIWLLNDDHTELKCIDLYLNSTDQHSSGIRLKQADYPRYFSALETCTPHYCR